MTLSEYLTAKGISAQKFAAKVGVDVATISRAARGEVIPKRDLMVTIFMKTHGKVQPNDFYGIAPRDRSKVAS